MSYEESRHVVAQQEWYWIWLLCKTVIIVKWNYMGLVMCSRFTCHSVHKAKWHVLCIYFTVWLLVLLAIALHNSCRVALSIQTLPTLNLFSGTWFTSRDAGVWIRVWTLSLNCCAETLRRSFTQCSVVWLVYNYTAAMQGAHYVIHHVIYKYLQYDLF